ncbi:hypothetical protein Dimus_027153, partial [Dionaea muscipula]
DPIVDDVVNEIARATAADTVAPPKVVVDEASKIAEKVVIKTTETADKVGLEEVVEIARVAAVAAIVEE